MDSFSAEVKVEQPLQHMPPYLEEDDDEGSQHSDSDSKRPRLRLARACDRCKRRKIKCDTNSPCLPCITAKQQCTFNTPTRRSSKPAPNDKPRKNVKDLEARMASLEQQLRQVPPHVHNAALTKLDASLLNPSQLPNAVASSSGTSNRLPSTTTTPSSSKRIKLPLPPPPPPIATPNSTSSLFATPMSIGGGELNFLSRPGLGERLQTDASQSSMDRIEKEMGAMNLSPGFIYLDEQGMTKWQGATSGFPLLELLAEAERQPAAQSPSIETPGTNSSSSSSGTTASTSFSPPYSPPGRGRPPNPARGSSIASSQQNGKGKDKDTAAGGVGDEKDRSGSGFFPGRKPRTVQRLDPEASWKSITGVIPPDLMDVLIRSYLSTTHLLWPFLHVPSFLADYANPSRWGESGFARFIVAVCTLSSRHVDDPRVRANPADPSSAGKAYLELFKKMQDLPSADRPTLYSMQASFLAAIYCMGLGTLTTAFRLFAESITMAIDGGLHRDVGAYDIFNPIEREVRKRTFWSIYCWDKQSGACFGRPAMIHLRDCDVSEPMILDDQYITAEGLGEQPEGSKSRICAFVAAIRLHVVLEGVLDGSIRPSDFASSPFLSRAALVIAKRHPQSEALREEEELLEEWVRLLEPHWNYSAETISSKDPIRITQAERLHCLENLVKMLIYRHRFSGFVLTPAETPEERARHLALCRTAMSCALAIVADHLHISQRGYMTYYGVHVIHQLAQAGRTLVAVILNCKSVESRPLIASSIEGFRSCVGLLRRFSGRYICGLRSADILEEFCRICRIPVDSPQVPTADKPSPAWLRPVRKRHSPSPGPPISGDAPHPPEQSLSPSVYSSASNETPSVNNDIFNETSYDMASNTNGNHHQQQASYGEHPHHQHQKREEEDPTIFMGSEFFDINEAASPDSPAPMAGTSMSGLMGNGSEGHRHGARAGSNGSGGSRGVDGFNAFGEAVANSSNGSQDYQSMPSMDQNNIINSHAFGGMGMNMGMQDMTDLGLPSAGVGMDGLIPGGAGNENLSASEILALLQEGSFDYAELFPDQPMQPMSTSFGSGSANNDFTFQF